MEGTNNWLSPTLVAVGCWGLWGFLPKLAIQHIQPRSIILYEVLGAMIVAGIAWFALGRFPLETHPRGALLAIITGMLGLVATLCFTIALTRGNVTLVVTLSALYPVVTIVLANLFLKEALTLQQMVGVGLALLAMILIAG
jgi:bacterial/archaeal transporter family protein